MDKNLLTIGLVCLLAAGFAVPLALTAQDAEGGDPGGDVAKFRPEELDQMMAPIALYPDSLLAQVMAAATYPLEVVEASRLAKDNPSLKGDQLAQAAKDKDWDPSVKALLEFPDVLGMMNDKLEWTQDLGDAFLGQQRDVMDSIQRLRSKAQDAGSLKTSKEQVVKTELDTSYIVIEPADLQVVYVPVYDPAIVYGTWWWPAYPPFFYYPFGWVPGAAAFGFWAGAAVGTHWGWCGWNWSHHEVNININNYNHWTQNHYNNFNKYQRDTSAKNANWQHDPSHRKGDSYRDPATAQKYGQGDRYRGSDRLGQKGLDSSGQKGFDGRGRGVERGFDNPGGKGVDRPGGGEARRSAFNGGGFSGGDRAASMRGMGSFSGGSGGFGGHPTGGFGGGGGRRR